MAEQEILNVRLEEGDRGVVLLDQSQLPNRVEYRTVARLPDMVEAIQSLRVRGAPAIGIFAGYCLYVLARQLMEQGLSGSAFLDELNRQGKVLVSSRPTAVNLAWAVGRLTRLAVRMSGAPVEDIVSALGEEARAIRREDEEMCQKIAEHGLSLLKPGDGVLTHCNAGPLATSKYGTALGPILLGHERGIPLNVFADETRPLLQGARLTAWELVKDGIPATLITDSMAASLMAQGKIDMVFLGCDRMARNGDFANKIGTYGLAVLASYHAIPFYTVLPSSTIDMSIPDGSHIVIEERDPSEVTHFAGVQTAPDGVGVYNPAFDVTPHQLLTGIVTERGVIHPPFEERMAALFE